MADPVQTAKAGYLGQLTEVTALQLAAAPPTLDETATRQRRAAARSRRRRPEQPV